MDATPYRREQDVRSASLEGRCPSKASTRTSSGVLGQSTTSSVRRTAPFVRGAC